MQRKINRGYSTIENVPLDAQQPDLHTWLTSQAIRHKLHWLLAYAEDGIIWGELRGSRLALSCEAYPVLALTLRWETLQRCRLFGEPGELLLWRGPQERWQARLRRDGDGIEIDYLDEHYLLWGNTVASATAPKEDGFLQVIEGSQGIVHAPPISTPPTERARACLLVRHYLAADQAGVARITASRLVRLLGPGNE